jgi:hypothetical protein
MVIYCECRHTTISHRPIGGACYDCHCSVMRAARVKLHVGERRILGRISESAKIGAEELRGQLTDDPAADAIEAILENLSSAGFVQFVRPSSIAATPAGRQYLQEHPNRG